MCDVQTGIECWSTELPRIVRQVVTQNTVYVSTIEGVFALDLDTLKPLVTLQLKPSLYVSSSNDAGLLLYLEVDNAGKTGLDRFICQGITLTPPECIKGHVC